MKIGVIVPGFSADESDWCIPALLNFVRELSKGHEVHVFALRYPHRQGSYSVHGATVHALGGANVGGLGRAPLLMRALARIAGAQQHRRFDLLHGMWADEPGFLAVVAGRLWGIPAVSSLMGGELVGLGDIGYGGQFSHTNRWLTRLALQGSKRVTVGSSYLYGLAAHHLPGERLQRVPLGVDIGLFSPAGERSTALVKGGVKLLHVASLVPVKDQRTLLQALARVVRDVPDVHLHVVGDGPLRPDLEQAAGEQGLMPHLTFHGGVSHEQLPAYYRAADLCVLSSRYESQGMVILEAAACGRATVGTAVGLLPELEHAAGVVPVGNGCALGEAILSVLQEPARLQEMGMRARAYVASTYALERTMAEMLRLYAEVMGKRNAN